jgi:hypothetical protein
LRTHCASDPPLRARQNCDPAIPRASTPLQARYRTFRINTTARFRASCLPKRACPISVRSPAALRFDSLPPDHRSRVAASRSALLFPSTSWNQWFQVTSGFSLFPCRHARHRTRRPRLCPDRHRPLLRLVLSNQPEHRTMNSTEAYSGTKPAF